MSLMRNQASQSPQQKEPRSAHERKVESLLADIVAETAATRESINRFHSCFQSFIIYFFIVPLVIGIVGTVLMFVLMLVTN